MPVLLYPRFEDLLVLLLGESGVLHGGFLRLGCLRLDLMDRASDHLGLRHHVLKDVVAYEVHVERESIGAWIRSCWIRHKHSILCSDRVSDPARKALGQDLAISEHDSALAIHVVLGVRHLLA